MFGTAFKRVYGIYKGKQKSCREKCKRQINASQKSRAPAQKQCLTVQVTDKSTGRQISDTCEQMPLYISHSEGQAKLFVD